MKYLVWALFSVLSFSLTAAARADQGTQVGATLLIVDGTHSEPGSVSKLNTDPAPEVYIDHRSKRWDLFAESVLPLGPQRVSTPGYGLNSVALSYVGASARYALTANTSIGIGETLYNQRSLYQEPAYSETDTSRLAGAQFQVVQSLRRSVHASLDLIVGYNPHMTANLYQTYSDEPGFEIQSPERGDQLDTSLKATVHHGRTTVSYGLRYIDLTMHFPDGSLADRNSLTIPFVSLATDVGR